MNEGLAVLGTKEQGGEMQFYYGVFERSGLRTIESHCFEESGLTAIAIPSRVTFIGDYVFHGCKDLRHVELSEDSALERIGSGCFRRSGI